MADFILVNPVIDYGVRSLCVRPYPGHAKGCPNYGKKDGCPPKAPLFDSVYDTRIVLAVVNEFNLAEHIARMRLKQPTWSERQLACCLYWQPKARKQLKAKIKDVLDRLSGNWKVETCPEAMGVDITTTLYKVGIYLEWPPKQIVRQVALVAKPLLSVPA